MSSKRFMFQKFEATFLSGGILLRRLYSLHMKELFHVLKSLKEKFINLLHGQENLINVDWLKLAFLLLSEELASSSYTAKTGQKVHFCLHWLCDTDGKVVWQSKRQTFYLFHHFLQTIIVIIWNNSSLIFMIDALFFIHSNVVSCNLIRK